MNKIFNIDFYRNTNGKKYKPLKFLFINKKLKLLYWFRKYQSSRGLNKFFAKAMYRLYNGWNNNNISLDTKIGKGLYLGHSGGRYINGKAKIGDYCNINHNVTIGQENRGKRKGAPTIGNYVWIGCNSTIVGKINIGDNVLIAPNTFVNFDVPSNSIVIGSPGKIIKSENPTINYINNVI